MDDQSASSTLRRFRSLFEGAAVAGLTDGQLLERFATGRGVTAEVAFEALLIRHGPMVLGVCRRALTDPNDVDDAFQATFLVLVRKARSVRLDDSLGRWLYGVSRKVASRAKVNASKRRTTGLAEAAGVASPTIAPHVRDLAEVLDDELSRLPEPYRSAVTLCDLAGLTLEEAARDLRCPVGTIKSRLSRGRDRLRTRLIRRGVAPAAILIGRGTPASAALIEATARAASTYLATGVMSAGLVPATALILAEGVIQAMTWTRWKMVGAVVMSLCLAATGAGLAAQQPGEGKPVVPVAKVFSFPNGANDLEMAAKLDARVSIHRKDRPLGEVIALMEEKSGLKIGFESQDANWEKWAKLLRASLDVDDVTLRTALTMVLHPAKLMFWQQDDGLIIGKAALKLEASRSATDHLDQELLRLRDKIEAARQKSPDLVEGAIKPLAKDFAEVETTISQVMRLEISLKGKPKVEREPILVQIDQLLAKVFSKPEAGTFHASRMANDPTKTNRPPREGKKITLPSYVVEAPDIIVVEVLEALPGRPLQGEHLVRPDGTISLGFYGDLHVAGLTTTEIKAKIVLHLRTYLTDEVLGLIRWDETRNEYAVLPEDSHRVLVDVVAYNSKVYYVQGDVGSPGRLPVTGNDTVLDAINYAAGVTGPWRKAKIRVVRPSKEGEPDQVLTVDLQAIIEKGDGATNYQLMPRDRLVVEGEPPVPGQEARMREMERKLELILQKLDDLKKP